MQGVVSRSVRRHVRRCTLAGFHEDIDKAMDLEPKTEEELKEHFDEIAHIVDEFFRDNKGFVRSSASAWLKVKMGKDCWNSCAVAVLICGSLPKAFDQFVEMGMILGYFLHEHRDRQSDKLSRMTDGKE